MVGAVKYALLVALVLVTAVLVYLTIAKYPDQSLLTGLGSHFR